MGILFLLRVSAVEESGYESEDCLIPGQTRSIRCAPLRVTRTGRIASEHA